MNKMVNGKLVELTQEEKDFIEKESLEFLSEKEKIKWLEGRVREYPLEKDMVVAMWGLMAGGSKTEFDRLEKQRQKIKLKYPKPE